MNAKTLKIYLQLIWHFKNGTELIRSLRGGLFTTIALPRLGPPIVHPPNQRGLVEVITEIWCEDEYFKDGYRLPANAVVVDVGANIGVFALWCHKKSPTARIVCFEPARSNFECLEANLASLVKEGKAELHKAALGASSGTCFIEATAMRSLDVQISDAPSDASESVETIPVNCLLQLANADEIDLLKIDIEGAEKECFEAALTIQFKVFKRIVIEYHDHIRPGTCALITHRLEDSHVVDVRPSTLLGCGLIIASRR